MWLVDIQTQLISNLEKAQLGKYKENVYENYKEQANFKVGDQVWLQWQNIKMTTFQKIELLKIWSILHCEKNQWCGPLAQDSKFHENSSFVSCFIVEPY